jgi:hypothetical protein
MITLWPTLLDHMEMANQTNFKTGWWWSISKVIVFPAICFVH